MLSFTYIHQQGPQRSPSFQLVPPNPNFVGGTIFHGPLSYTPVWNDCTGDYRPSYGLNCTAQKYVFSGLPSEKADTPSVAMAVWNGFIGKGGITDLSSVSSDYWMQPEFFPGWNGSVTVNNMLASGPYWTPYGYGSYPFIQAWNLSTTSPQGKGTPFETFTLLHSAFNVSTYQGFGIVTNFPSHAYSQNGSVVFSQDPSYASQHIRVSIDTPNDTYYTYLYENSPYFQTNLPNNARFVVMSPTKYSFVPSGSYQPSWVIPIRLQITLNSIQPGNYVVTIVTFNPNSWLVDQYSGPSGLSLGYPGTGVLTPFVPSGGWYNSALVQYIIEVTA